MRPALVMCLIVLFCGAFVLGCGNKQPAAKIEVKTGPPTPTGEPSPLTSGGPEAAEKAGRGPGRNMIPEGAKSAAGGQITPGQPRGGGPPGGPPGGPGGAPSP